MEEILIGTTDRTILVWIPDPSSTTGAGKTGLAAAAVTVTYTRVETDNDVVHSDATSSVNDLSALTDAHNDWGWKEVSSTLSKGLYRLDLADAVFATGAWYAVVQVTITSGTAAATPKAFKLVAHDPADLGTKQSGDSYAIVNSGTHGNAALKTLIDAVDNFIDTEITDLGNRLPAALVSGRIDASVGAMAANVLTAAAAAADFGAEIADAVLDEDMTGHQIVGTLGNAIGDPAGTNSPLWDMVLALYETYDPINGVIEANTTLINGVSAQASIRAAIGLASANLDTQLTAIDDAVDTEIAATLAAVDTEIAAIQSTLSSLFTTALTESYRADGATGSVAQLLYEINQTIGEREFLNTVGTVKKIDGSTTAFTQTLDSASSPTLITRAT